MSRQPAIPIGTQALILSKRYYGVLTKSLEEMDIERYFSILYFLHHNNRCSQQHICNNLSVDKTAMVKVMDYLIKAGYVKRLVNPDDRREHFVALTAKGKKRTLEIVNAFKLLDEEMFTGIPLAEKDIFMKVMTNVTSNLVKLPYDELFFDYSYSTKKTRTKSKTKP